MNAFLTRNVARMNRDAVNAKAKATGSTATLRAPVKGEDGLWSFPGLKHQGKTLSLKKAK